MHKFSRKANYLKTQLGRLKTVSQLNQEHPVHKYVLKRKIPNNKHYKLFYAPKFYKFVNECVPNKIKNITYDEQRLVIPFLDSSQNLIGFQGRAFGKSQPKYITIMLDEDSPKIYGLDTVDWSQSVTIVEGPIDSMFIENSIAMAGADVSKLNVDSELRFCYDNEPRSKEIVGRMESSINKGHSIVVFPNSIKEKDINDMILAGRSIDEIQSIITRNTYKGLTATAKLSEWRKI